MIWICLEFHIDDSMLKTPEEGQGVCGWNVVN